MVRVYLIGLFRMVGREGVPRTGALIVCANHPSTIDPPVLPAFLPRTDSWSMAKSEFFERISVTSLVFRRYHAFPVVRHSPDRRGLRRARDVLHQGGALVVYPEGTRVESGQLERGEPGAGFIARSSGVPVLPVGLVGTNRCVPKGARWPRRAPVEIRFGAPIWIKNRRPDGRRVENQEATDAIMLAIAALLPEEVRGVYADVDGMARDLDGVIERRTAGEL